MDADAKTEHVAPPPIQAGPAATYGINPPTHVPHPHPSRSRAARVAVALVLVALTAGLVLSLAQGHSASLRAARAEQQYNALSRSLGVNASQTSANGGSVTTLKGQFNALQSQVNATEHYAVCYETWTDNNGFLTGTSLSTPVIGNNGNIQCPRGVLVSVVPVPGG